MQAKSIFQKSVIVMLVLGLLVAPVQSLVFADHLFLFGPRTTDVIWATIELNGDIFEIHVIQYEEDTAILEEGFGKSDIGNTDRIYVLRNGVYERSVETAQAILYAQSLKYLNSNLSVKDVYLPQSFLTQENREPQIRCGDEESDYLIYYPNHAAKHWINRHILYGGLFGGFDCEKYREEYYADMILEAVTQPSFYQEDGAPSILNVIVNVKEALGKITPLDEGYDTVQAILKNFMGVEIPSNELIDLVQYNDVLKEVVPVEYLKGVFAVAGIAFDMSADAAELMLVAAAADQAAASRLASFEHFINANAGQLDPALAAAMVIAKNKFDDLQETQKNTLGQAILKAAGQDIAGTVVKAVKLAKLAVKALAPKLLLNPLVGQFLVYFYVGYMAYKYIRAMKNDARMASMAANLQRVIFDAPWNIKTLVTDLSAQNTVDAADIQIAIDLFQMNTYLSHAFFSYQKDVLTNPLVYGNWLTWILWPFGAGELYQDIGRQYFETKLEHVNALETYLRTPPGSINAWLVAQQQAPPAQVVDPTPEITFVNPSIPGTEITGPVDIEVTALAKFPIDRVEIEVRLGVNMKIKACTLTEKPYICTWDTTNTIFGDERYNINATAYDDQGNVYTETLWIRTRNENINKPPEIELISPDGDVVFETLKIKWEDEDLDDNALISLYYDTNASGYDGELITSYLQENWIHDYYVWAIPDSLPHGDYWIYAEIDDGENPPVRDYSPGPVTVSYPAELDSMDVINVELQDEEGDNDGIPDSGELLELSLELSNKYTMPWYDVAVRLSTANTDVTITDDYIRPAYLEPDGVTRGSGDFEFVTDPGFVGQITFDLEIFYENGDRDEYVDLETIMVEVFADDTTPPSLASGPTVSGITPDAAVLNWVTDEVSEGYVEYGLTTAYGSEAYENAYVANHQLLVRGLLPNTEYFYRLHSADPSGNSAVMGTGSFTTTNLGNGLQALETRFPNLQSIFGLAWVADSSQLAVMWRDHASLYFLSMYDPATDTVGSTVQLTFMVEANNRLRGLEYDGASFWTTDSSDELIYRFSASGAKLGQYVYQGEEPEGIAYDGSHFWVTDEEYATICKLDGSLNQISCFAAPGVEPHGITWDGTSLWVVDTATWLLYEVSPTGERLGEYPVDNAPPRNVAAMPDGTLWVSLYSTLVDNYLVQIDPVLDLNSPVIVSGPVVESQIGSAATVYWVTDEPTDGIVEYGLDAAYGSSSANPLYVKNHSLPLNNLNPDTTYHYRVCSLDMAGNEATCSADATFTTASQTDLNIVNRIYAFDEAGDGFAIGGGFMWALEDDNQLFKVDLTTGDLLDTVFMAVGDDPRGLAWDGSALWFAEDDYYPDETLVRVSTSGSVLSTIPSPDSDPTALAWDGHLWVLDQAGSKVFRLNPSTGGVISSFSIPWTQAYGLAVDGTHVWIYVRDHQTIYKMNYAGDTILGSYPIPGSDLFALTYFDGHLWAAEGHYRYQMTPTLTSAPVVENVLVNGKPVAIASGGSPVVIQVYEQFERSGFTATVTITSLTDDPGIVDAQMTDLGNGIYQYVWNTAGQMNADDYEVEVQITDGTFTDADGLSSTPDATIILAKSLSVTNTYTVDLYNPSQGYVSGVAAAGSNFWVTERNQYPAKINQIDLATGAILKTCDSAINPGGYTTAPVDLVWDGTYLWVANDYTDAEITRHNPGTCDFVRFSSPTRNPDGITYDGTYFWISDDDLLTVTKMDSAGNGLGTYPIPGGSDSAIVWDGAYVWVSDFWDSALKGFSTTTLTVEDYLALRTGSTSLSWDGTYYYGRVYPDIVNQYDVITDVVVSDPEADENIAEGTSTLVSAEVYAHDVGANNVVVRFYLGDPLDGGVQLGTDHLISTLTPGTAVPVSVSFSSPDPGAYEIFVVVDEADTVFEGNENNNTASIEITVYDTDTDPPVIGPVVIEELTGDFDGVYEDNETLRFSWTADDPSGVAESHLELGGVTYPAVYDAGDGVYEVVLEPLEIGTYPYIVSARDADNTPETAEVEGSLDVLDHSPEVTDVYPPQDAEDVARNEEVMLAFNKEMALSSGAGNPAQVVLTDSEGQSVTGAMIYDNKLDQLTVLTPFLLAPLEAYTIEASDSVNLLDENGNPLDQAFTASFTTIQDLTPPVVELDLNVSRSRAAVTGPVDIYGSLYDEGLMDYRLEYAYNEQPFNWQTITTHTVMDQDEKLLGIWDTDTVPAGDYILRLTVVDEGGNVASATQMVIVGHLVPSFEHRFYLPLVAQAGLGTTPQYDHTPTEPDPEAESVGVSATPTLSWQVKDPDPAALLTYDVYLAVDDPDPTDLVCEDLSAPSCTPPAPLTPMAHYYWVVVVSDGVTNTTGPVWDFIVTIENSPPFAPSYPNPESAAENVALDVTLSWTGGDPDLADSLTYDVYLDEGAVIPVTLICDDVAVTHCTPPAPLVLNQPYSWRVAASDGSLTSIGPVWTFITRPGNLPPNMPDAPDPADGEGDVALGQVLTWTGGDPDAGDAVTYDVYLDPGTGTPTTLVCDDAGVESCDPGTLAAGQAYVWQVAASDGTDTTTGPVWDFTTLTPNQPPNTPDAPGPADGEGDVALDRVLTWTGGDPDAGDTVTYDVYLDPGTGAPTTLVCDDVGLESCDPGTLAAGQAYVWQVAASDGTDTTTGPVWDFTTMVVNQAPNQPSVPNPANTVGDVDIYTDLTWMGGDPDAGDTVTYDVYLDAGEVTPTTLICDDAVSESCTPPTLLAGQVYSWQVTASDGTMTTDGPIWFFTTIANPVMQLPFVDDFSTNQPWVDEGGSAIYRDSANEWLVWQSHRNSTRRYYIPINGSATDITLEFSFAVIGNSGNGMMYIGLAQDLDWPGDAWPGFDVTGPMVQLLKGSVSQVGIWNKYPDGTYDVYSNPDGIGYGSGWYDVVFDIQGSDWTLTLFDSGGTQVGQIAGTFSGTFTGFNYIWLGMDATTGNETMSGYFDNIQVTGSAQR